MKRLILTLCFVFMANGALAMVTDWPHNETSGITCTNCHSYSLWWQFSPVDGDPVVRAEKTNSICTGCHTGEAGAQVFAESHSSTGMGAFHNTVIAPWARACTDCHDPHFQAQLNWYGDPDVANEDIFVVTGKVGSIVDNGDSTSSFSYSNIVSGAHVYWDDNVTDWLRKSGRNGRGLLVSLPITEPAGVDPVVVFEIIGVDEALGRVTISGVLDVADDNATFGLLYGQLIRNRIEGAAGPANVKFFDPYGGFVDSVNNEGVCQVCHTETNHFRYDDNATVVAGDHSDKKGDKGNSGQSSRCTSCHTHVRGFAPASDGGQHPLHLGMEGVDCNDCHTNGTPDPLTEVGCNICHNDGTAYDNSRTGIAGIDYLLDAVGNRYGLPNDMTYRNNWNNLDPAYSLNCNSCHNGRLNIADVDNSTYFHQPGDTACDSCHDETIQVVVGMQTNGHTRLASSKWIRQYDCFYCHADTVGADYSMKSKHVNHDLDVVISSQWTVVDQKAPKYTYNDSVKHPLQPGEEASTCYNVYCHTDGTTLDPEMRAYPWTGGHQECNACHGHSPSSSCTPCHTDGRKWDDYPDKKWLSAMPMYPNTGPRTDKANSHYRHLFSGFSCDDCHFATIAGGGCLDCHGTTIPTGNMTETKHINAAYHVNRSKNIVFKGGGTYNPINKSCNNTACHTGYEPEWGGSVYDSIVCRKCHGVTDQDVDDFGKFNGTRAKINLTQWAETGHGRQGSVDPVTGDSDNPYASNNPPAKFPDNGCWYCHDSRVLHQDRERPFRLIQHEQFSNRYEKECVFCHMEGKDYECLKCHNDSESLAPQLDTIDDNVTAINPPYSELRPDHRPYNQTGLIDNESSCGTCHVDDDHRHKTGAGVWSLEQKDDVKNSYMQMGVCLKCHDDDSSGECASCHVPPTNDPVALAAYDQKYAQGFDPADLDSNLVGKTAGKIVAVKAKASSIHFGYKHFAAYENSLNNELDAGVVSQVSTSLGELIDATKSWVADEFIGRRVKVTLVDATVITRPIIANSNTVLTVAPDFPDDANGTSLIVGNEAYQIMDYVWKGGKFCWDCHDPHGDDNIYMIQNEVATRTDGVVGKPITRKEVHFTNSSTGADYASTVPDPVTGAYYGICNVCHTDSGMHYKSDGGDGHNNSRRCTECHEHRFTSSHASNQACNTCHRSRPVPRHTGFGQARDCTKCHKDSINNRMNIMKQFSGNSHHVQNVDGKVTNKHCYACHWEATKEGIINVEHHSGYNYKTHESIKNAEVDLVVWGAGERPTLYDDNVSAGNVTAVTFLAKDIDIWSPGSNSTLADQRTQVDNITVHCLGCHSDKNNDTQPFNIADPDHGDCKTPRQYSWDRGSIAARYTNKGTASFGKYSGPNVAEKTFTKSFAAHGNAIDNEGGWSSLDGEDESANSTRSGLYNIQCFDCHSSHGSYVSGVTSSYVTFNGTRNGANLKETQGGKGGYPMTYKATANPDPAALNPYQPGAGQCFDCHETANAGTPINPVSTTPWGYQETFGATAPIMGYRDSNRFADSERGVTTRFPYRKSVVGGHFKASNKNANSPNYDTSGASDVNAMGTIDGLCSPCHDPHGVSLSLGNDMAKSLPMLKGTWLTSPYKEDSPNPLGEGYIDGDNYYNTKDYFNHPRPPQERADGRATGAWRTDRNTFNDKDLSVKANYPVTYSRISEEPEKFAGLCLRCHSKNSLTSDINPDDNTTLTENLPWKSRERIHRAVKGWGWLPGDKEREHSYTCSKCHSAHVSGLPRLMKTNCLDVKHRGQQMMGGVPGDASYSGGNHGRFPYGWWDAGVIDNNSRGTCHGAETANGAATWPDNQSWNNVTPWEGQ